MEIKSYEKFKTDICHDGFEYSFEYDQEDKTFYITKKCTSSSVMAHKDVIRQLKVFYETLEREDNL